MASAGFELQRAVYSSLSGDATLAGLLGGAHIYDDVPRDAAYPYVTVGQSSWRDWSTGGEDGEEHTLTLHVWSDSGGHRETHHIMTRVRERLHDAALTLTGHHLVNLRHEFSEARRDAGGESYRGLVRFRAVTEPLS
jgi:hypothetical protein